jgi:4'-phosphopantetheinyl transferase
MVPASVELWWAKVSDVSARLETLEAALPSAERRRAERFRVAGARARFVVGRTLLRRIVGRALAVEPRRLIFELEEHGRPVLADPSLAAAIDFNLSHSDDTIVLAVSPVPVGVDVEAIREVVLAERLARRFFAPDERDAVLGAEAAARARTFLRIWTQKEAWLKATGMGIGMALRAVEVEPDLDRPPRLVAVDGDPDEARGWFLVSADIPDAVCTVAVLGDPPRVVVRRVDSTAFDVV